MGRWWRVVAVGEEEERWAAGGRRWPMVASVGCRRGGRNAVRLDGETKQWRLRFLTVGCVQNLALVFHHTVAQLQFIVIF